VTQTVKQLKVINNARVVLNVTAAKTLTLGAITNALVIEAGSTLIDSANAVITIAIPASGTGSISGTFKVQGLTAATGHKLTATSASSLSFESGSLCWVDTLFTGNLFGTTALNSVVFKSGSAYAQKSGSNPFGASAPNAVAVFQTGSKFSIIGALTPSFSGRTYADFEFNAPGATASTTGGSACSIDNLTITAGRMNLGMTGTFNIKGNITVGVSDTLNFKPAISSSVTLNGSAAQTITNSGILTIDTTQNFVLNNSNGFTLAGDATLNGTLTFTTGKLSIPTGTLTLGATAAVSGIGSGKIIDGNIARKISATGKLGWPVGQGTDYLPDTLFVGSVSTTGTITIQALDKTSTPFAGIVQGPTQILKRYYHTTGTSGLDVGIDSVGVSFSTGDLTAAGVFASDLQVLRWNGSPWVKPAVTRIDSTVSHIVYVKGNLSAGDYVLTGPAGFLVASKTDIGYGTVLGGQTKVDSVIITNSGNASLSVDSVRSTAAEFTVDPISASIPAGAAQTFKITYAPITAGSKAGTVVFYNVGINGPDTVSVSGGVSIIATFTAVPDSLDFGTLVRNTSKTDTVVVSNSGNIALVIDSVRSPNPAFTVSPSSLSIAAGGTGKFFFTYKPADGGAKSAKVVFYSNGQTQPDTVYVKGDVVIAPLFSASKTSFDFGAIFLGKQKTDSVTVTNAGTSSLDITSIETTDSTYTITPLSATLAIDAAQKFYITFAPKVAGSRKASIVAISNVPEIRDTLKVTGFGATSVTIAEARKDANNDLIADHSLTKDTLVISGVITTQNMGASAGQTSHFIQDSTGGIDVFAFGIASTTYSRGDSVLVIGTVAQFRGLDEFTPLVLNDANFQILKHSAAIPKPRHLTLHQFVLNAESYEGQLIEIDTLYKATGTWPAAPLNASIYMTNASGADTAQMFLDLDAGIGGPTEPTYPVNVVGIVSQFASATTVYNNGYEIAPRDSTDISKTKIAPSVSIAEARKDANSDFIPDHSVTKDTLAVHGVITSPNLQASGSQTAYFIQDTTGGIEVFAFSLSPTSFAIGDSVVAVGTVAQFRGLTEFVPIALDADHFGILKHGVAVPKAKHLTLHQFVTNAESYEGQLIELDTLYKASGTWPAALANASIYVTNASKADTTQLFIDLDTDIDGTPEPQYPIKVVGIASQFTSAVTVFNNGYEIVPRDTSDIAHRIVVSVNDLYSGIPKTFELLNNYPNPFNPSTTILYGLPQLSKVTLKVYSVLGQEITTLVNEVQSPSYYRVVWNGSDKGGAQVSSGVYFFRIVAEPMDGKTQPFMQVKKMLLMK
jgi:DNA/RNA endonuclease YhcR with UshA esterase domain